MVARQKIKVNSAQPVDTFALVVGGQSYTLVRAEPIVANPNPAYLTHYAWRPLDETQLRIRIVGNGASVLGTAAANTTAADIGSSPTEIQTYGRGGVEDGANFPRTKWQVWTKDGTLYEFAEDLWQGWDRCAADGELDLETYKWMLSRVVDPHGNTMTYAYKRNARVGAELACDRGGGSFARIRGTVDRDAWPISVTWGSPLGTSAPRFAVYFDSRIRSGAEDTEFDGADNMYLGVEGRPRETRVLSQLRVETLVSGAWQRVRSYSLTTDFTAWSDQIVGTQPAANAEKVTLKQITQYANDGQTYLPATTFTYGAFGTQNWNRLTGANNGQGGTIAFAYEELEATTGKSILRNYRRVTTKTISDGRGNSYTWSYSYQNPALNSLGSDITGASDPNATQFHPNSAKLYYSHFLSTDPGRRTEHTSVRAVPVLSEFRGHSKVIETLPTGNRVEHEFYQGDAGCSPLKNLADPAPHTEDDFVTGIQNGQTFDDTPIVTNTCWQTIREREFLKGQEWRTVVLTAAGAKLSETRHALKLEPTSINMYAVSANTGLWGGFTYTWRTAEEAYEGGTTPSAKKLEYFYDYTPSENRNSNGKIYGNLTRVNEEDQTAAVVRSTTYNYIIRDDMAAVDAGTFTFANGSPYLADRVWVETVLNGSNQYLARTFHGYDNVVDGTTGQFGIGYRGDRTRTSKVINLPLTTDLTNQTLATVDTTFVYSAYGNQTDVTTYAGSGTARYNGGASWSFSAGSGSAPSTTTTAYETTYNTYPTSVQTPPNQAGERLTETAAYDYRMGTLTSVPDLNGNTTTATYDGFGRPIAIVKPGDSATYPTVQAQYYDWEQPFRYVVQTREIAGTAEAGVLQRYYDGLGREIQTKRESVNGTQNIVADKVYDGLGNVVQESQPRYVNGTGTAFTAYTPHDVAAMMRWTTTSYDALNRPRVVTRPDGVSEEHVYDLLNDLRRHHLVDANRHRTEWQSDSLGRLRTVVELAGDCGAWQYSCTAPFTTAWAGAGTTTYTYSPLDLLIHAQANRATMTYDSLGRKLTHRDPDMGTWSYAYDVDGNLVTQTDAKAQTITFAYDNLNRLLSKTGSDGRQSVYAYDAPPPTTTNGRGQRTSMAAYEQGALQSSSAFAYDARGRPSSQSTSIAGLVGARQLQWSYDSADRPLTIIYPDAEQVSYTYDAAGRETSVCSNVRGCFANAATYTALDQPATATIGGRVQSWSYTNVLARLDRIQVAGGLFDRAYTYDPVGNVTTIANNVTTEQQTQTFQYDHRDRLTRGWTTGGTTGAYDETYAYDAIGNLQQLGPWTATYPASGTASVRPHAVSSRNNGAGQTESYTYDANGNMTAKNSRTFAWSAENQLLSVIDAGGSGGGGGSVVRINAGGPAQTVNGTNWSACESAADCNGWVSGGKRYYHVPQPTISGVVAPANQDLYQIEWTGDPAANVAAGGVSFTYNVPVSNGTYSVRLHFAENVQSAAGARKFDVNIEGGTKELTNFDVYAAAGGKNKAIVRSFTATVSDGRMTINFIKQVQEPMVNAIEVIATNPAPPSQPTVRINAGGYAQTVDGTNWSACRDVAGCSGWASGGLRYTHNPAPTVTGVAAPANEALYQAEWTEDSSANIPVGGTAFSFNVAVANGSYTVRLHFAENVQTAANARKFDVNLEGGTKELTNFDVYTAAGGQNKAIVREFPVTISDGTVNIQFIKQVQQPFVNAIEIVPAGGGSGAPEQYSYDADGERVTRTRGSTTTFYIGGLYEEDVQPSTQRASYMLNGQVVAMREGSEVTSLYHDHLGSASMAINGSGQISKQEFTPWGKLRSGGLGTTKPNYTGQRLDDTGLLYYHARYYDPVLGRFISADSVVPGAPDGSMDGVALKPLTVDFHEGGFTSGGNDENRQPFHFQMSREERQETGSPWGPANAQALNRYSYVQNNPVRHTDPTGHDTRCDTPGCAGVVVNNSNTSVEVVGDVKCDAQSKNCRPDGFETVAVILRPGESTIDYGIIDADFVRALPGHTLSGFGPEWMYKLVDGETLTIINYRGQQGRSSICRTVGCVFARLVRPYWIKAFDTSNLRRLPPLQQGGPRSEVAYGRPKLPVR